jgi:hypothetical protein
LHICKFKSSIIDNDALLFCSFANKCLFHCLSISPNTNSNTQKKQGNKPDRPDFKVTIGEKEVSFGEVTGPTQMNDKEKNGWDLYRLSRFGTAVLNEGAPVVPLIQVLADVGTVYRHFVKARGIMVLAEVGVFSVPTATIHMGALLASLPTLFWYQVRVQLQKQP